MEDIILKIETEERTDNLSISDPENTLEINYNIYQQLDNPEVLNLTKEQIEFIEDNEICNTIEIKLNTIKETKNLIDLVNIYFEYGWDEDEFLVEYMKVQIINKKTNEQLYFKEW
jgi:hypothetical protein